MTHPGDRSYRIAQDARRFAAEFDKIGLLQTDRPEALSRIAPEVQTCVRRGIAEVVAPAGRPRCGLLVVHGPSQIDWTQRRLVGVHAERTVLVCYDERDLAVPRIRQRLRNCGALLWAPVHKSLRATAHSGLELPPSDWLPWTADLPPDNTFTVNRCGPPVVGWILTSQSTNPPPPATGHVEIARIELFATERSRADDGSRPARSPHRPSLDRLSMMDAVAYFPAQDETDLADTIIATALAFGKPLFLHARLRLRYGKGPVYCMPEAAASKLLRLSHKAARRRKRKARLPHDRQVPDFRPPPRLRRETRRPIMFVASNGVGVGHVSRLLAIARRIDPNTPVFFASQAQAVGAIERMGYLAHYIPSASYVGGDFAAWDNWFAYELERLIDSYDPAVVVYDGNNPSDGLVQAFLSRRDCRSAWIRRGLWGNTVSPFMDNARWFDLIIEPGELEGQPDDGVTARRRWEARVVAPVRLLDAGELLPRQTAATSLGLDPARPAVLVQLGSGFNRDIVSVLDELVLALQRFPELQIGIAEWVNGTEPLNYWPGVRYIRGFPLSQYYRAFDFSVSAAGYNTFHEAIAFGLPTIFMPNTHPSMDDQVGRVTHAQGCQAAFELSDGDLGDLPDLVRLLMNAKARDFLASNCLKLAGANGAGEAARMLEELAWTPR
jgi:UDP:flavonoid glycosyltransferase YjiC (YdhE family)